MIRISFAVVCCFTWLGMAASAQAVFADDLVIKEYDFKGYDRLEVGFAIELEIHRSNVHQAIVELDKELVRYLRVTQRGSTLKIDLDRGFSSCDCNCCRSAVKARISMPKLVGLKLNTAATAVIEKGFGYVESFDLDLQTASSVKGHLQVGRARFELSSASSVDLTGSAKKLHLELSGASTAKLSKFTLGDARADLSGASTARLIVNGELDADVSGCSTLRYGGTPQIRSLDSSGLSTIKKI